MIKKAYSMVMIVEDVPAGLDHDIDRGHAVLHDPREAEPAATRANRIERLADRVDGDAEIDQRAEHHVAGGAARAVEMEVQSSQVRMKRHDALRTASRAMRTAATAAPTPLSMFTIEIPGAQPARSEPSATRPSTDTP